MARYILVYFNYAAENIIILGRNQLFAVEFVVLKKV
jgi:hypothetical protein